MDKKVFDDAIGELPPSSVRVDEAIARGRRVDRVRSVATSTGAVALAVAAVVLAIGAVAFAVMPDPAAHQTASSDHAPASDGVSCPPQDLEPPSDEPADVARERLTTLARDLVGERLPAGAVLTGDEDYDPDYGPLAFHQDNLTMPGDMLAELGCDAGTYFAYNGLADIESAGRSGHLAVNISTRTLEVERCERNEKVTDQPVCELSTGAGGEKIQARTDVLGSTWEENVVWVAKPDGTFVTITSARSSVSGGKSWPRPPLSLDQLVEIALAPGMTLFP